MTAFPKLDHPVLPAEVYVVLGTIDDAAGRAAIEHVVTDGFLRPFDITNAEIAPPEALYVPFWRIDVKLDGAHVEIGTITTDGGRAISVPTGAARFRDVGLVVCARSDFPYTARLPRLLDRSIGNPPLEIAPDEMLLERDPSTLKGDVIDADVDRERAEKLAWGLILHGASPLHAIHATYQPEVHSAKLCLYPVYYASYRYEGEARSQPGESRFVAVSGIDGSVIAARHPSAVRAVAAKLRRALSFDRRR